MAHSFTGKLSTLVHLLAFVHFQSQLKSENIIEGEELNTVCLVNYTIELFP